MNEVYDGFLLAIANFKWKAQNMRALFRRNPSYLAEGFREALEATKVNTKRSDWPIVCLDN